MNKLIENELKKILKKKSFIIMLAIIMIFMIINNIIYFKAKKQNSNEIEKVHNQYNELVKTRDSIDYIEKMKEEGNENLSSIESEMDEYNKYMEEFDREELDNEITYLEYVINSSEINNRFILKDIVGQYDILVIIYVIMIAGTIVSEEFNKGTIKLLLVKPYSRMQIFVAKFIATLIMLIATIAVIIILQTIIGGCFFGFSSLGTPVMIMNQTDYSYEHINVYRYILNSILAILPRYLIIIAIAIACSTIMLSTSMSIIIPICIYLFADTVNGLIELFNSGFLKFALRFLVTLNWDFTSYLYGGTAPIESLSLGFSAFVCILYFVTIIGAAIRSFNKKDIRNI